MGCLGCIRSLALAISKEQTIWLFLISLAFLHMSEDQEIKISETSSTRHIRIDITQFALGLVSSGIIQGNLEGSIPNFV